MAGAMRHLYIPKHSHPFVKLLFEQMNDQGIPLDECGRLSGITPSAISGWRKDRNPKIGDIEACLNVMGLKLVTVKNRSG